MNKLSSMAELRMVDTIKAAREKSGKGVDPSEAVAKLAMEQNLTTEQAARICEAVNKIASIDHLSTPGDDRAKPFPLADSGAVRKIMKDSLKIARDPFKFRRSIDDELPLPKLSNKEALDKIYKPTDEERKWLDTRTERMEYLGKWMEVQHRTEAMKKASEDASMAAMMVAEAMFKFARKMASADKRRVDDMARYAVYTYGTNGVNFLTALENLSGVEMDKSGRTCVKTGSEDEKAVDNIMYMADSAKAIKLAADLNIGGVRVPNIGETTMDDADSEIGNMPLPPTEKRDKQGNLVPTTPADQAKYREGQIKKRVAEIKNSKAIADAHNQVSAERALDNAIANGERGIPGAAQSETASALAGRIRKMTDARRTMRERDEEQVKGNLAAELRRTLSNDILYNESNSAFRRQQQPVKQRTERQRDNTASRQAGFEAGQQDTLFDTQAAQNRVNRARAHFSEDQLPTEQETQRIKNELGLTDAQFDQRWQQTRQQTQANRNTSDLSDSEARLREQPREQEIASLGNEHRLNAAREQKNIDDAIERERSRGNLEKAEDLAVARQKLEDMGVREADRKAHNLEEYWHELPETEAEIMRRRYDQEREDREWQIRERNDRRVSEGLRSARESADRTSKFLNDIANNTIANTKAALMGGVGLLQKADAIRQALTQDDRSGNSSARPLSNDATKYLENLKLHDVFAKTYLSDPYLHQYSPKEVAEAFNIVYEVAPQLIRNGSNPHVIGALIRKYLANSNQLDPLEIRDLTSTEKDRMDVELKKAQLEALRRGKTQQSSTK